MMQKINIRRMWIVLAAALALALITGGMTVLLLRSAGNVVRVAGSVFHTEVEEYALIMDQLKSAQIRLPFVLRAILCLAGGSWIGQLLCAGIKGTDEKVQKSRIAVCAGICVVMILCIGAATLWLAEVNGIRFGTAVRFLMQAIKYGAL